MNLFFGKISKKKDLQQIEKGYYLSKKNSSWFNGIQIDDYAFLIGGDKIQLWQAEAWKQNPDRLTFKIIFDNLPLSIKDLVAIKYFELNVDLIIKTTKSTAKEYKAFFKIDYESSFTEAMLLNIDTYEDPTIFRDIKVLNGAEEIISDCYDIQLYFEKEQVKIAPIKNCVPFITNNFKDNLPFINQGQRNKDKILSTVKYQQNLGTSIASKVSIMRLYEAFMCKYMVKKRTTKYWVVNGFNSEKIEYCLENDSFVMQFQYHKQPNDRVTVQLQESLKIREGDKVLLFNSNKYYGHGTFITATQNFEKSKSLKEQINKGLVNNPEEIVGFNDAPCFYEDLTKENGFDGKWGQRLSIDEWLDIHSEGIIISGIKKNTNSFLQNTIIQLKDNSFYDKVVSILSGEVEVEEDSILNEYIHLLKSKHQIILQGPPGTGKTYQAMNIAEKIIFNTVSINKEEQYARLVTSDRFKLVQFHPSYTYEDFVRGINTVANENNQIEYKTENKILTKFANKASSDSENVYLLVIDEINRANLQNVLGELVFALEYRGRKVESMYSIKNDNSIILPSNLLIIGTMNTADRSVGHIDYAIKRRFSFVSILPNATIINHPKAKELFNKVAALFVDSSSNHRKSDYLAPEFNFEDIQLGHSYFIVNNGEELAIRLKYEILPILKEYVKDGILLETAEKYIKDEIESFI